MAVRVPKLMLAEVSSDESVARERTFFYLINRTVVCRSHFSIGESLVLAPDTSCGHHGHTGRAAYESDTGFEIYFEVWTTLLRFFCS